MTYPMLFRFLLLSLALMPPRGEAAGVDRAGLVAGYKALFTCSATFLADRTLEQVERNELTGVYRDYTKLLTDTPPALLDRKEGIVSVPWDSGHAPRIAHYRDTLGCTLLPPDAAADLPLPHFPLPAVDTAPAPWPEGDITDAPALRADSEGPPLSRILARAFNGSSYGARSRTSAVVIVSDGKIIGEAYSPDSGIQVPQRTWSVAKTIMAALIGIASGEGLLKPEDRAALPQWQEPGDPRADIRIIDLLHMSSGLDAGARGNRTDEVYFGGARVEDQSLSGELIAPPGSRWNYANNDTLALSYVLRQRLADDGAYLAYPHVKLFRRIGMKRTVAETDWGGTYILSSQVWTTARDLARFGLLLLDDGRWNGERVLPEGWVKLMITPSPVQPPPNADGTIGPGYGAQTWLFGRREGLPEGSFAAMGNRGQHVMVIPSHGMVLVRRGFDPEDGRFDMAKFTADVLAATGVNSRGTPDRKPDPNQ